MRFSSVTVLGCTGSIGTQTIDVLRRFRGEISVAGLSATGRLAGLLAEQVDEFRPAFLHIGDPANTPQVKQLLPKDWRGEILEGPAGLSLIASDAPADLVLVATVGWTGLEPALAAIDAGRHIALANKEVLVCGGHLVMEAARRADVLILPVDSEHNAIHQCLAASPGGPVRRLILTCSGGPFRESTHEQIAAASCAETLNHPTWDMGAKITVDSATLMNKGLEVIEAHHLFGVPMEKIEVVIHPQSTVHSMVEFEDGSILAQLGPTDMRLPIQYALTWPDRCASPVEPLNLAALGSLTFQEPDLVRFPCLAMAYEAGSIGGSAPAVLNAANEVAVQLHLDGRIPCGGIPRILRDVLSHHQAEQAPTLERLRRWDSWGRDEAIKAAEELGALPMR